MLRSVNYGARAWQAVEVAKTSGKKQQDEFLTRTRSLPVMMRTSGLAATVAFLLAKSHQSSMAKVYGEVYATVDETVRSAIGVDSTPKWLNSDSVDMGDYFVAEQEVEEYLVWLKRMAEAAFGRAASPGSDSGVSGAEAEEE